MESRTLLIGALCFWACYLLLAEADCIKKEYTKFAFYKHQGNWEKCKVKIDGCRGDCHNDYEHLPHKVADNFNKPEDNCKWSYRQCKYTATTTNTKDLYSCVPVSGGTSAYSSSSPWTVNVKDASSCHCGSTVDGEGAGDCPLATG